MPKRVFAALLIVMMSSLSFAVEKDRTDAASPAEAYSRRGCLLGFSWAGISMYDIEQDSFQLLVEDAQKVPEQNILAPALTDEGILFWDKILNALIRISRDTGEAAIVYKGAEHSKSLWASFQWTYHDSRHDLILFPQYTSTLPDRAKGEPDLVSVYVQLLDCRNKVSRRLYGSTATVRHAMQMRRSVSRPFQDEGLIFFHALSKDKLLAAFDPKEQTARFAEGFREELTRRSAYRFYQVIALDNPSMTLFFNRDNDHYVTYTWPFMHGHLWRSSPTLLDLYPNGVISRGSVLPGKTG